MLDIKELVAEAMQEIKSEIKDEIKKQLLGSKESPMQITPIEDKTGKEEKTIEVAEEKAIEEIADDGVRRQGDGLDIVEQPPTKKSKRQSILCPKCGFKWQK